MARDPSTRIARFSKLFGMRVVGVCRDFTHLAITLCRCLNNGFLGDIGVPPDPGPMDFSAWFEAFLDGKWYTFDARHNTHGNT
jgi:transglutaminase-like putative cysteine protease